MGTQRSGPRFTRRRALAAAGGLAAGLAGCVGTLARSARDPVAVLVAGSLQRAVGRGLREAVDPPLDVEAHGSVTAARLVDAGRRDPDIVALADAALFSDLLDAPWHAALAANALVVATADTPGGRRVRGADRWFDPLAAGRATLARTDPALDPLGYRTLFALALAEAHYGRPDLRADVLDASTVVPETSMIARLEAGAADAAVLYRSMAVERGYAHRDLPPEIDLSDPALADHYRTVGATVDGRRVRGAPITYGVRARRTDDRTLAVYRHLAAGDVLAAHGFDTAGFPRYRGSPPAAVRR